MATACGRYSARLAHVHNSPTFVMPDNRPPYNPAFMHPEDLADHGLATGETSRISSARATITAVVQSDPSLRRGVVSMSHSWGGPTGTAAEGDFPGVCTGLLVDNQVDFDPYTGQPRMSNIPVRVAPNTAGAEPHGEAAAVCLETTALGSFLGPARVR